MTKESTVDLILKAGAECIARAGPEGASVRAIADRAGIPAPTLQHHFRSKADLLEAIYGNAVEQHLALTAGLLDALSGGTGPAGEMAIADGAIADAAAALVAEWLGRGAPSTAVLLHLLVHTVRDPAFAPLAGRWLTETARHVQGRMRLEADGAAFLVELAVGLALVSGPACFRCESEMVNRELLGFVWRRESAGPGDWLARFRALHAVPPAEAVPPGGGVYGDILDAGVTLTVESGADALSYRKIAARAQVAPSSVLYHFPDRRSLLTALYRAVHRRFAATAASGQREEWQVASSSGEDAPLVAMFAYMITQQMAGDAPLFLASCELFLVGWREADLAPEAFVMRLARGALGQQAPADRRDALLSQLHSIWSLGLALAQFCRPSENRPADVARRLRVGMEIIGGAE